MNVAKMDRRVRLENAQHDCANESEHGRHHGEIESSRDRHGCLPSFGPGASMARAGVEKKSGLLFHPAKAVDGGRLIAAGSNAAIWRLFRARAEKLTPAQRLRLNFP